MKKSNPVPLRRLLLWQKLTILGLLAMVMVALPSILYFNEVQDKITVVENEINGIDPSIATQKILQLILQHRDISSIALLNNKAAAKDKREQVSKEISVAIEALDSLIKNRIQEKTIIRQWNIAVKHWRSLHEQVSKSQIDAQNSDEDHSALIVECFILMDQIADYFKLSLDSDPKSYFLMRSAIYATPKLIESLGRTRAIGTHILVQQQITPGQVALLSKFIESSQENQSEAFNQLQKIYVLSPQFKSKLQPTFLMANEMYLEAMLLTEDKILKVQQPNFSINSYFEALTSPINALFEFNSTAMNFLNTLLVDRKATLRSEQLKVAGGILSLFASIALVAFFIARSITRPVEHLVNVTLQLANGNKTVRADMRSTDEMGILGRHFDSMVDQLEAVNHKTQHENEALNNSVIQLSQAVARLAQGDLTVKVPVAKDLTGLVADALNLLASETANVLNRVMSIAAEVATVSKHIASQSHTVIHVAEEGQREVEKSVTELNSASKAMLDIEKLALACNQAANKAIQITNTAEATVLNTVQGISTIRDTIRETEKRITKLGERSQNIGSIVTIINNIAEQTHILALNASMHTALAGSTGQQSFSVVAGEIKSLAESAHAATAQISDLIRSIQTETIETIEMMNEAIFQMMQGSDLAQQAGNEMRQTRDTTTSLVTLALQIADSSKTQAEIAKRIRERVLQIQKSTGHTYQELLNQEEQTKQLVNLSDNLVTAVDVFTLPR